MRILFIVPYTPNLIRTRPYNLIKGLANRGHEVTVACLWNGQDERDQLEELADIGVQVVGRELKRWRSYWNCLKGVRGISPLQGWYSWHSELARAIAVKVQARRFDVVHVEHLRGVRYALALSDGESGRTVSGVPIIWDSVDSISYLFDQARNQSPSLKTRLVTGLELDRTRRFESWLTSRLGRILVTSEADRCAFLNMMSASDRDASCSGECAGFGAKLSILPNGVDLDYFCPNGEKRRPDCLVFSGKMSYHANEAAALYLLKEIMPAIWRQRPNVHLWIVGKDPGKILRAPGNRRVHLTGYVKDIRPYLRSSSISLSPVVYGAGIQNKVLEAMACATPVIATTRATSALEVVSGRDLVIADDSESFVQHVLTLLAHPRKRDMIGIQGRRFVEDNHNWDAITSRLEAIYIHESQVRT